MLKNYCYVYIHSPVSKHISLIQQLTSSYLPKEKNMLLKEELAFFQRFIPTFYVTFCDHEKVYTNSFEKANIFFFV